MAQIPLAQYSYKRADGLLPSINVRNMYLEKTVTNLREGSALLTRPFLTAFASVGTGPNRGLFWEDDVFADDALVASGGELHRMNSIGASTLVGVLSGFGRVEVAYAPSSALVASGGRLQQTDGVTLTPKTFPDSLNVVSVAYMDGYFLAVPENSHRIYFTDLLTGEFDATRFVSAERYPDNLVRLITTADEVWAMGSASVEVFVATGVDDPGPPVSAPFQRVDGRLYKKGVLNGATVVEADNSVIWASHSKDAGMEVYRGAGVPLAINDEGIAERLARADPSQIQAWSFGVAKHSFFVLCLGSEGTWAYDIALAGGGPVPWFEWTTLGRDQWRAINGKACWPGVVLAGDDETGDIWRLDDTGLTDGGEPVEQVFTAGAPVDGRPINASLSLDCAVGQAAEGVEAVLSLRTSDTQGRTWDEQEDAPLGLTAEYDARVRWNRLGQMFPPARIFEWTTTAPVRMRVSSVRVNDDY